MTFSKSFPRTIKGSNYPRWEEVFISEDPQARIYCQYCINPGGALYDARKKKGAWNSKCEWAVKHYKAKWAVEMRIPYKDLQWAYKPSSILRFNICRNGRAGGDTEPSGWSPVLRGFNEPARLGYMLLGSKQENLKSVFERKKRYKSIQSA